MKRAETVDAIVVGAGPAGLAVTAALAAHGRSVRVIDEQPRAGGQIWRGAIDRAADGPGTIGTRATRRARAAADALRQPGVEHAAGASVIDARVEPVESGTGPGTAFGIVEVTWLATAGVGAPGLRDTRARALVIATGAMERPVLFPGATLPGVMSAGAVQGVMKQAGMVPDGADVVLAGQGPLLRLVLAQVLRLGGRVDAVLELAPARPVERRRSLAVAFTHALLADPVLVGRGIASFATGRGPRRYRDVHGLRAHGDGAIERISFESSRGHHELPCRLLAVHDGVLPNVQLTRLLGLEHLWNDARQAFSPVTDEAGRANAHPVWVAGDGRDIAGAELATLRGRLAGLDVVRALGAGIDGGDGETGDAGTDLRRHRDPDLDAAMGRLVRAVSRRLPARRLVDRLYPALPIDRNATADTIVCRCEAVTLADIDAAIDAGAVGANRVKTFTRCGMGACQGRLCSNTLTRIIAERLGVAADAAGALRVRPPLKPTLIGDYLGESGAPA